MPQQPGCKMMMGTSLQPHGATHWWGRDPTTGLLRLFVNTEFDRMAGHSHQAEPDKLSLNLVTLEFLPAI